MEWQPNIRQESRFLTKLDESRIFPKKRNGNWAGTTSRREQSKNNKETMLLPEMDNE